MSNSRFDVEGFFSALDSVRSIKKRTWKQVAQEADIAASTLTRIGQGRRPDIDGLAALCTWANLDAGSFYRPTQDKNMQVEPIAQITALLRADKNLTGEGAIALEAMIKSAYANLRKNVDGKRAKEGLQD